VGETDASPAQAASNPRESLHSWLSYKRLAKGRFVWPQAKDGAVSLTPAQLSMLLEGIDWRMPARTWRPEMAG
jgi:transposase